MFSIFTVILPSSFREKIILIGALSASQSDEIDVRFSSDKSALDRRIVGKRSADVRNGGYLRVFTIRVVSALHVRCTSNAWANVHVAAASQDAILSVIAAGHHLDSLNSPRDSLITRYLAISIIIRHILLHPRYVYQCRTTV